jgi:hypothetical protein
MTMANCGACGQCAKCKLQKLRVRSKNRVWDDKLKQWVKKTGRDK